MYSIQLLLPLFNKTSEAFPKNYFSGLRTSLADKFGGITTYTRSPATGLWKETPDKTVKDDIIIYEVMADELDKEWWKLYRQQLESLFNQDEIIIRSWRIEVL